MILLAFNRAFGPEYFQSHTSPIIYCTPDPVLIGTIKRAILQVNIFIEIEYFIYS